MKGGWQNRGRQILQMLVNLLCASSVGSYPIAFLYAKNISELTMQSMVAPFLLFLGISLSVNVFFLIACRNVDLAVFDTVVVMLYICNFRLLERTAEKICHYVRYWHIATFLIVLIVILLCYAKKYQIFLSVVGKTVGWVFWGLILINLIPCLPAILSRNVNQVERDAGTVGEIREDLPNIYYMVFDEYSSVDFMRKYYDYDNTEFTDYLEDLGFQVSYSSYNEGYATQICMTNIMNLDFLYDMDDNDDADVQDAITTSRWENKVFELLRKNGYQIQGIGIADFYGLEGMESGNASEKTTLDGETAMELIIENTILYPYYVYDTSDKLDAIKRSVDCLLTADKSSDPPKFTLFHIESTHVPWVMDEFGEPISSEHVSDWQDRQYYKGTYIYTTNVMKELAENILEEDSDSILVLSSDHSARAANTEWSSMFETEDKCKIFNALYYRGEEIDIEGLSGINTMRVIMNHLLGTKYDMIETYPLMRTEEYHENE